MEIKKNEYKLPTDFKYLLTSEVFVYENKIGMRVFDIQNQKHNVVWLESGELCHLDDDEIVYVPTKTHIKIIRNRL